MDALIQAQMNRAKKAGRDSSYDTAYEEVVANSCEKLLADGTAVEKLAKLKARDKSVWQKIKDYITELTAKIRKVYEGLLPDSAEGRYIAQMNDTMERLQELFIEGLSEAGENYRAAQDIKDTGSGKKYSVRKEFAGEIDAWDGKSNTIFSIGSTSKVLHSLGIKNQSIIWHGRRLQRFSKSMRE